MPIANQYIPCSFLSDGSNRRFNFNFPVIKKEDVIVKSISTDYNIRIFVYGVDYIVEDQFDYQSGGWVLLDEAQPLDYSIVIERSTPLTQEMNLLSLQTLSPRNLTFVFDKLTIITQELNQLLKESSNTIRFSKETLVNFLDTVNELALQNKSSGQYPFTVRYNSQTDGWNIFIGNRDLDELLTQSTEVKLGVVMLATIAEAIVGSNGTGAITPSTLAGVFENRKATQQMVNILADTLNYTNPRQTGEIASAKTAVEASIREQSDLSLQTHIDSEVNTRLADDVTLQKQIDALAGRGGALPHHDFGTMAIESDEGQRKLTQYACECIWGTGGTFTWNPDNPSQSIYTIDGTVHRAAEIFNATWMRNDYNDHRLLLTNTPDTEPQVFDWADVGIDVVSIANADTAGVVKAGIDGSGLSLTLDGALAANVDDDTLVVDNNIIRSHIRVDDVSPLSGAGGNIATKVELTYNEYLSLSDEDKNANIQYFIVDLPGEQTPNLGVSSFIGSLIYGIRTDSPLGYLRCDGNEYPANTYNFFVDQYLVTGKIPSITLAEYQEELDASSGNCGYFGYDGANNILRVPKLDNRVFIAQTLTNNQIGSYGRDQIVNITGDFFCVDRGYHDRNGAFYNKSYWSAGLAGGASDDWGAIINFNASKTVNTGDRVQPRHVTYPLFVCVSNESQPIAEENMNLFVQGLDNKSNVDGSNFNGNLDFVMETHRSTSDGSWYRKYRSGWVEQGGSTLMATNNYLVNLPVLMADQNYSLIVNCVDPNQTTYAFSVRIGLKSKNSWSGTIIASLNNGTVTKNYNCDWVVRGMAAQD